MFFPLTRGWVALVGCLVEEESAHLYLAAAGYELKVRLLVFAFSLNFVS
jgi:hypothetical protein